jgi:hypothetical protein
MRTRVNIFIEKDLVRAARQHSLKYRACGKEVGSASWYIRNAVLERLKKDGAPIESLDLTDYQIWPCKR